MKKKLKPFNEIIQVCPKCGKVDVFLNDGHTCDKGFQDFRKFELYGNETPEKIKDE